MAVISPPQFPESGRRHDLQAAFARTAYGDGVRLIQALALAARQAREEAGRKQVHIAVALGQEGVDQSTIARFETGRRPRDLERTLLAYSQETGKSLREIVLRGLDLYESEPPTPEELAEDLEQALELGDEEPERKRRRSGREPPSNGSQSAES